MKTNLVRLLTIVPAFTLLALPARILADEATARADAAVSEMQGDNAKASLDALDVEIDRLDAQIDNAPTPQEKDAAKARMDVLKERRSALRKTFVKARYNELTADVRAEANHIGAWTKSKFHRNTTDNMKDSMRDAGDKAYATASAAGAEMDLAAYKLRPTDTNKAEAKAAIKALDHRIDELDDRADKMPRGAERDAAKRRVKALEDQKDELKHDFNKARFDALVDSVQNEWNDLRN